MRQVLAEIVRQTAPLFEKIRITGTDAGVKVEAHTENKMLFVVADIPESVPDLAGEFGIGSLSLLNGLLNFASYKAEDARLIVHRTARNGENYVSEFEFRDTQGGSARFRTMNPSMVNDQAKIASIPWDVTVTPSKAKITEVTQLAGLLSEVDKNFSVHIENKTLFLTLGGKGAASHSGSVALVTDVEEQLAGNMVFAAPQFLTVLKAASNYQPTVRFSSKGAGGITITAEKGTYNYILRPIEG